MISFSNTNLEFWSFKSDLIQIYIFINTKIVNCCFLKFESESRVKEFS